MPARKMTVLWTICASALSVVILSLQGCSSEEDNHKTQTGGGQCKLATSGNLFTRDPISSGLPGCYGRGACEIVESFKINKTPPRLEKDERIVCQRFVGENAIHNGKQGKVIAVDKNTRTIEIDGSIIQNVPVKHVRPVFERGQLVRGVSSKTDAQSSGSGFVQMDINRPDGNYKYKSDDFNKEFPTFSQAHKFLNSKKVEIPPDELSKADGRRSSDWEIGIYIKDHSTGKAIVHKVNQKLAVFDMAVALTEPISKEDVEQDRETEIGREKKFIESDQFIKYEATSKKYEYSTSTPANTSDAYKQFKTGQDIPDAALEVIDIKSVDEKPVKVVSNEEYDEIFPVEQKTVDSVAASSKENESVDIKAVSREEYEQNQKEFAKEEKQSFDNAANQDQQNGSHQELASLQDDEKLNAKLIELTDLKGACEFTPRKKAQQHDWGREVWDAGDPHWSNLMRSSVKGQVDKVKELVGNPDLDVNKTDPQGRTALMASACLNRVGVAKALLGHKKIKVDHRTLYGWTALIYACRNGHLEIVKAILQHREVNVNLSNTTGVTPLGYAAGDNHPEIIKELLKRKEINVNQTHKYGGTALIAACRFGCLEAVQELLKHKSINVNTAAEDGSTALVVSSRYGYYEIFKKLVEHPGVRIDDVKSAKLRWNTGLEATKRVQAKSNDWNQDVWDEEDKDWNELMLHSVKGNVDEVCKLLKNKDLDVNKQDTEGRTALMASSCLGHCDVADALLKRKDIKVNLQHERYKKWTALIYACRNGHLPIVLKILKNSEVDINLKAGNGTTPLGYAAGDNYYGIVHELLKHNDINVNQVDNSGWTVLMTACRFRCVESIIELLKHKDINVNAVTDKGVFERTRRVEGITAVTIAAERGFVEIVLLLKNHRDIRKDDVKKAEQILDAKVEGTHDTKKKDCLEGKIGTEEVEKFSRNHVENQKTGSALKEQLKKLINFSDDDNWNKLMKSTFSGDVNGVQNALAKDKEIINRPDEKNGYTPLMIACLQGYLGVVNKLLGKEYDVDVAMPNQKISTADHKRGNTALHFAASEDRHEIVSVLAAHLRNNHSQDEINRLKNVLQNNALHVATWEGAGPQTVQALLNGGININAINESGNTALHHAAITSKDPEVIRVLLNHPRVQVNLQHGQHGGNTPLHQAAVNNPDPAIIGALLKNNDVLTEINLQNNEGNTPLHEAAACNNVGVVQALLATEGIDVEKTNKNGDTALHLAVLRKSVTWDIEFKSQGLPPLSSNPDVVKALLENKGIISNKDILVAQNTDGDTPLHLAAAKKDSDDDVKIVELLKSELQTYFPDDQWKCKMNKKDQTPYELAFSHKNHKVADLIRNESEQVEVQEQQPGPEEKQAYDNTELDRGQDSDKQPTTSEVNKQVKVSTDSITGPKTRIKAEQHDWKQQVWHEKDHDWSELMCHSASGNVDGVRKLLDINEDLDVNKQDTKGRTALMASACLGHLGVAQALLARKNINVNLQARERGKWTALIYACRNGHLQIAQEILKNSGVDINVKAGDGSTALFYAAGQNHGEIIQELLKHDQVYVNQVDSEERWTALMIACRYNCLDSVVELLKHKDINVNVVDCHDKTALKIVSEHGFHDIVRILLQHPAIKIEDVKHALKMASEKGFPDIVRILLQHPAIKIEDVKHALKMASEKGFPEIVRILLQHPAIKIEDVKHVETLTKNTNVLEEFEKFYQLNEVKDPTDLAALRKSCDDNMQRQTKAKEHEEQLQNGKADHQGKNERVSLNRLTEQEERDTRCTQKELILNSSRPLEHDDFVVKLSDQDEVWNNLMISSYYDDVEGVQEALKKGKDIINRGDENNGYTALMIACQKGHIGIVQKLLGNQDIDVTKDTKGTTDPEQWTYDEKQWKNTALHFAAAQDSYEIVEALVGHLQKNDLQDKINLQNSWKNNALHMATWQGAGLRTVRALLDGGININARNETNNTALHHAAITGKDPQVVRVLLNHQGIEVNLQNDSGNTPLHQAAINNPKHEIIRALLENKDVKINMPNCEQDGYCDGNTALQEAAASNNVDVVEALLAAEGIDVKARNKNKDTALHLAISRQSAAWERAVKSRGLSPPSSNPKVLKALLKRKEININSENALGRTALHLAVLKGIDRDSILDVLLGDVNIKVNAVDKNGYTALMLAALKGYHRVVQKLLDHEQIDANQENKSKKLDILPGVHSSAGSTALHFAAYEDKLEVVKVLVAHGKVDNLVKNDFKNTALHMAAWKSRREVVEELLKAGIDVNATNNIGNTALHDAAINNERPETLTALLSAQGIEVNELNYFGETALHKAAINNPNAAVMKILARHRGMNINLQKGKIARHFTDRLTSALKNTALHEAVAWNNVAVVEALLSVEGIDISVKNADDDTVLHLAISKQSKSRPSVTKLNERKVNPAVVDQLLQKVTGANKDILTAQNKNGDTPLHLAAQNHDSEDDQKIVKFLLDSLKERFPNECEEKKKIKNGRRGIAGRFVQMDSQQTPEQVALTCKPPNRKVAKLLSESLGSSTRCQPLKRKKTQKPGPSSFVQADILRHKRVGDPLEETAFVAVRNEELGFCRCYDHTYGPNCEFIEEGYEPFGDKIGSSGLPGWGLMLLIGLPIIAFLLLAVFGFFWIRNILSKRSAEKKEKACIDAFNKTEAARVQAYESAQVPVAKAVVPGRVVSAPDLERTPLQGSLVIPTTVSSENHETEKVIDDADVLDDICLRDTHFTVSTSTGFTGTGTSDAGTHEASIDGDYLKHRRKTTQGLVVQRTFESPLSVGQRQLQSQSSSHPAHWARPVDKETANNAIDLHKNALAAMTLQWPISGPASEDGEEGQVVSMTLPWPSSALASESDDQNEAGGEDKDAEPGNTPTMKGDKLDKTGLVTIGDLSTMLQWPQFSPTEKDDDEAQ